MIYSNENYREYLIETIETLNQAQQDLFTMGVNLMMNGELLGINDCFQAGDTFEFFPEHLDNTDDQNLQIIMKCVRQLLKTMNKIQRINQIQDDEVDWEKCMD